MLVTKEVYRRKEESGEEEEVLVEERNFSSDEVKPRDLCHLTRPAVASRRGRSSYDDLGVKGVNKDADDTHAATDADADDMEEKGFSRSSYIDLVNKSGLASEMHAGAVAYKDYSGAVDGGNDGDDNGEDDYNGGGGGDDYNGDGDDADGANDDGDGGDGDIDEGDVIRRQDRDVADTSDGGRFFVVGPSEEPYVVL